MASVLLFCLLFLSVMALKLSFLHLYIFFHILSQTITQLLYDIQIYPFGFLCHFRLRHTLFFSFAKQRSQCRHQHLQTRKQRRKGRYPHRRTHRMAQTSDQHREHFGVHAGTIVEITTISGELFKSGAGNDGFIRIDMTDAEPGVYIVKAGEQQVKIYKR